MKMKGCLEVREFGNAESGSIKRSEKERKTLSCCMKWEKDG